MPTQVLAETMRAAQVSRKGGSYEIVQKEIPSPGRGEVRILVKACGICHSDVLTKENLWPGIVYPRSPGHEIAGIVDAVGDDVTAWKTGRRVGLGWNGRYCGECQPCKRGDFVNCVVLQIPGIHFDAVMLIMSSLLPGTWRLYRMFFPLRKRRRFCAQASRLSTPCAIPAPGRRLSSPFRASGAWGISAFSLPVRWVLKSPRSHEARIKKRWPENSERMSISTQTGADPAAQLQSLGGARAILATAPSGKSMTPLFNGLGLQGVMITVGASPDPLEVNSFQLITQTRRLQGWPSGNPADCEDALNFCAMTGVRPMIETFPLDKVSEAFDRMISNNVRFRAVLVH